MVPPHLIYQLFTGRQEFASIIHHEGDVLSRLNLINWTEFYRNQIDTVYLLGIFDHRGPLVVNNENNQPLTGMVLPSPFAVTNHKQPDPRLGTKDTLLQLIQKLHQANLKVLVDFIPNHTGLAHPWIQTNPEYYLPQIEFSGDVKKLNYANPELRQEMVEVLRTIAAWGIDGVRVDMAHLIPSDFWHEAIIELFNQYPNFYFLAEAYSDSVFNWEPQRNLLNAGFKAIYEEFFYRNLHAVFDNHQPIHFLTQHLKYVLSNQDAQCWIHYLANHDDALGGNVAKFAKGLLVLLLIFPGMLLIPNGLLYLRPNRLAHHTYDPLGNDQNEALNLPDWYKDIVQVIDSLKPAIIDLSEIDGLITARLSLNLKPGVLLINGSELVKQVPQNCLMPGLMMNQTDTNYLNPGDYNLYFLNE